MFTPGPRWVASDWLGECSLLVQSSLAFVCVPSLHSGPALAPTHDDVKLSVDLATPQPPLEKHFKFILYKHHDYCWEKTNIFTLSEYLWYVNVYYLLKFSFSLYLKLKYMKKIFCYLLKNVVLSCKLSNYSTSQSHWTNTSPTYVSVVNLNYGSGY